MTPEKEALNALETICSCVVDRYDISKEREILEEYIVNSRYVL